MSTFWMKFIINRPSDFSEWAHNWINTKKFGWTFKGQNEVGTKQILGRKPTKQTKHSFNKRKNRWKEAQAIRLSWRKVWTGQTWIWFEWYPNQIVHKINQLDMSDVTNLIRHVRDFFYFFWPFNLQHNKSEKSKHLFGNATIKNV